MKMLAYRFQALARYYFRKMTFRATNYPTRLFSLTRQTKTIEFLKTTDCQVIAEIGVYMGATSTEFAKFLNGRGELHLFDFEDNVLEVTCRLNEMGYHNVIGHGNSRKIMDSYNWSLMKMIQAHKEPVFDYVFVDGAHSWAVDALAFFLTDKLLKPGGYIDFDDYDWTFKDFCFPPFRKMYTREQIETPQVGLLIDLLVKRDPHYTEVTQNKIFQKNRE